MVNSSVISSSKDSILLSLYYLSLLIISLSWTNPDFVAPSILLRIGFTVLFVLPLLRYPYLAPLIITVFATIRLFSISPFGYLPSQSKFYLALALVIYLQYLWQGFNSLKVNKGLLVLVVIAVISNIINFSNEFEFIRYCLITILLSRLLSDPKEVRLLEFAFVLVSFCLSIYGIIFYEEFIVATPGNYDIERMYWKDPNYLGCVLSIGIVIAFFNLLNYKKASKLSILFYFSTFVIGFVTLGLFASRGAFLAASLPMLYLLFRKVNSVKSFVSILLFFGIIVFAFTRLEYFKPLIARFQEDTLYTGSYRTVIWKESIRAFANQNIVTLILGGGSSFAYELSGSVMGTNHASPHNNFLEILYDYGILGLLVFLAMLVSWIKANKKSMIAIALILILIVSSLTLSPLMYLPFWLLIVLIENHRITLIEEE